MSFRMRLIPLISIVFIITSSSLHAQMINDTVPEKKFRLYKKPLPPSKGDIFIIAMPIISYNPTNGFMFGVGTSTSAFFGNPASTNISSGVASVLYTTKKQLLINLKSTLLSKDNRWTFYGDWRYMNTSLPTYGVGTGPLSSKLASNGFEIGDGLFSAPISEAQLLSYKQIKIYETVLREVGGDFYLGIGFHIDIFMDIEDQLTDTTADPPVLTSYFAYNVKYGFKQDRNMLSGFSLNASFDSRDNQNCPYGGQYANLSFHVNPEFMGSDQNSTVLYAEYRKFFDLTHDHHNILAFWGIGDFITSGYLPYTDLPALGEDQYNKAGRGYTVGRFRGKSLIYGEAEFRKHLAASRKNPDFLGMVFFVNAVTASNPDAEIGLFDYVNVGGGFGFRIMASKNARTKLGIDYARGNYGSSGFYIRMNETF